MAMLVARQKKGGVYCAMIGSCTSAVHFSIRSLSQLCTALMDMALFFASSAIDLRT